ncbi:phage tail protein [Vibrio parahaemolyticus]|uniref:phage tail-collar fiber domain-containing protein n=1 Tax=Vibrio parahaemolyticus TaxID=670 RepID=UPI001F31AF42|nr:phage tail protein [Vibrio parahaemolyticus]MDL1997226.1 phage tail protein [Vibrio parahaemolyticus]
MANTTDKSILTAAGKALLAQLNAEEKPLIIDKMMFANVPNRPEFPQPDDVVPTDDIVHQEQVEQRGRLSADSVIYSTTLTSDIGPFEFNWTGAYCSEYGVLVTIDHHALTPKTADEPGVAGNTLVRSVVLEYKDIAEITNITVDASSWQYNATDRMKKMDSDVAQSIIDQNGKDWFIEDGFLVTPSGSAYNIKAGAGYVSGNRVSMEFDRSVQAPNKPSFIYIDAHREGTPTGEQVTLFDFVITAEEKDDYIDSSTGKDVPHFVCKIAEVLADGSVSDLRPEGDNAGKQWVQERLKNVSDSEVSNSLETYGRKLLDIFADNVNLANFIKVSSKNYLADSDFIEALEEAKRRGCHCLYLPSHLVFKVSKTALNKNVIDKITIFSDRSTVYDEEAGGTIWTDADCLFEVGVDDGNPDETGFTRSVSLINLQLGRDTTSSTVEEDTSDVAVNVVNTAQFKMYGCRTFGFKNGSVRPEGGNVFVDIDDLEAYGRTGKKAQVGYGHTIQKATKHWGNFVLRVNKLHSFQYKSMWLSGKGRCVSFTNYVAENMQDAIFTFSGTGEIFSLSLDRGYGELIPGAFFRDENFLGVVYKLNIDGLEAHEAGEGGYTPILGDLNRARFLRVTHRGIVCVDQVLDDQLGLDTEGKLINTELFRSDTTICSTSAYDDELFGYEVAFKQKEMLRLSGNFTALNNSFPYGWGQGHAGVVWSKNESPVSSGISLVSSTDNSGSWDHGVISINKASTNERYALAVTSKGEITVKAGGNVVHQSITEDYKTNILNFTENSEDPTFNLVIGPVSDAKVGIDVAEIRLWKIYSSDATEVGWLSGMVPTAISLALKEGKY